ncbi:aminotransferase class III-fold pyridoxal phosphate-dependent enzyme [Paenibacillus sp. FSL M8-0142]|uniref:aspartate aminotransferase family protein n=1 Tax=Paenibacillus sp. FSL M8-0142 TaxID=2954525 RepID=UPI00315B19A8
MNRYRQSEELLNRSRRVLAGGVSSTLRAAMKPTPLYAVAGRGARIQDADGHTYIDYLLAYGPLILGHGHEPTVERLLSSMRNGLAYGLQHQGEIELAELLTEVLPCADQVAFSGSGTEAVMLALRLARAYTNRSRIIRFHGHYHGWSDAIFTSFPSTDMKATRNVMSEVDGNDLNAVHVIPGTGGQSEAALQDIILLPWNDAEALKDAVALYGSTISAIISEPVMCNSGCIMPKPGYLELMRELTAANGIIMILDEVITGFRFGLGGAHGVYRIMPDLITIGKALGGGIAISGVAGRADIMELIADGTVSHLGTLNGNCVATTAAVATINELSRDGGAVFARMEKFAADLSEGLRQAMKDHDIQGIVNQAGPVFHLMFTTERQVDSFEAFQKRDADRYIAFAREMLEEGVLLRQNGLWYVSAAHGEAELQETLEAANRVFARWEEHKS